MNSEKALIERAKHYPEAFGQLYDQYYPRILGYIYRATGDYTLACDIAAETFLKAWIGIGSFRWRGISISSWFFRIAANELNQHYRKKKYMPFHLIDLSIFDSGSEDPTPRGNEMTDRFEFLDEFRFVREQLQKLPVKYRQVITLRFFEELSISEIGEILHKKTGTVKSLLSRGLDKLKIRMRDSATNDRA